MNLQMDVTAAESYKSVSQKARVLTESWAKANLYCAECEEDALEGLPANAQAVDFRCRSCSSAYQLKSQKSPIGHRIVDAGYAAMCRAILSNRTPNLYLLQYDFPTWRVRNAILIPSFGLTLSAIEPRKPLGPLARRAGWVGCNIVLTMLPADLRIPVVTAGEVIPECSVRKKLRALQTLRKLNAARRGWLIDTLNVVRSLQREEFTLADVYAHEDYFQRLHPDNLHVREKVRQQLQKLRDLGLIKFLGVGRYHVRSATA